MKRKSCPPQTSVRTLLRIFLVGSAAFLLPFLTGCAKNETKVALVFPKGYTGVFKIVVDPIDGIVLTKTESGWVAITFDETGVLRVKSGELLAGWRSTKAHSSDGTKLRFMREGLTDEESSDQAVWPLGHSSDQTEYFLVGSEKTYEKLVGAHERSKTYERHVPRKLTHKIPENIIE